ncbi:hypothetical protein HAX54_006355 [Datura stramonium]|uniref:Uncharacterized protein n=1 Tax=Datura stramonium TaxID=4076 RepID=A0ABS8WW21_DATST|nr:hypothetical protein [Datura stramonium]
MWEAYNLYEALETSIRSLLALSRTLGVRVAQTIAMMLLCVKKPDILICMCVAQLYALEVLHDANLYFAMELVPFEYDLATLALLSPIASSLSFWSFPWITQ